MRVRPNQLVAQLAALSCSALVGCSAIFPAHPASEFKDGEETKLTLLECPEEGRITRFPAAALAPLIPVVAGFAIDKAADALETEAERYSASYSAKASGELYWHTPHKAGNAWSADIKLCGFQLVRTVGDEPASRFVFDVVPAAAGDAFEVTLAEYEIQKAKAKVFDARASSHPVSRVLLVGFFHDLGNLFGFSDYGDASLDANLKVEIEAVWVDNKGKYHTETISTLNRTITDINLDEPMAGTGESWGWLPPVPVSYLNGSPWGRGNFNLRVTVVEADDFGELVAKAAEKLRDNKEVIVERVTEVSADQD